MLAVSEAVPLLRFAVPRLEPFTVKVTFPVGVLPELGVTLAFRAMEVPTGALVVLAVRDVVVDTVALALGAPNCATRAKTKAIRAVEKVFEHRRRQAA